MNNQPITPSGGSFTAGAFSFAYQGRTFGVFLPDATVCTVSGSGAGAEVEPQLSGVNNYMVIGYLTASSDLAGYAAFAFARPTDTQIAWTHDPVQGVVNTTWTLTTTPLKGANLDTIQGWLPHHWRTTQHALSFLPQQYLTPRGVMKCATGRTFQIAFPFKGIAPVLPAPSAGAAANPYQPARMTNYMAQFNPGSMIGDTYWAAKALAFCAEYMSRAQQMGDTADYVRLRSALKTAMVNWLTYTPGEAQGFFTTYPNWHAFIGFDASYGSQAFNDLHFHYGYFAVAGALLGMQDSQFLADYGPMLRTIVKCYGNWDRADTSEPFLRTFDVWEGHSNAGGLSGGNGNNQESSSEAMQSWGGMFLLGNAMHDGGMAAAGAMGYAMESCTVNEYWQDIYQTNFPAGYNRAGNGILGADSYAYGTYFSGDPAWVYAIQYSPSNHWNNYLKRAQPATVAAKYQAMWNERLAWCQSQPLWSSANSYAQGAWVQWNNKIYHANSAVTAGGVAPDQAGAPWGVEADCTRGEPDVLGDSPGHVVMCYEALWDHDNSAAQFDNYFSANAAIASANGQAGSTYYLIHAQRTLGDQDFSYTTSLPTGAVYLNAATGARTYVVFNPQDTTQSVTVYHNGVASGTMTVPAHVTIATQNANYTATAPPVPTSAAAVASSGQVALTWTGSTLATSYTVRRGSSISGPFSVIGTVDAPGFTDTAVTGGATYFYTFSAANSVGESAQSTAVAATVPSAPALAINCGGSASGAFAADSGFSGGGTSNTASAIDTTGVTDPAPQAVYQTNRFGSHTYTLAGLTAGASYNVRLHFAEAYWNATGQRVFHININGTRVLSSFDIFAAAGAKNKAVIREFTASANASGQLVVQFVTATDNAQCNGIEIRVPRPVTPTNVTANGGPAQVALGWSASASAASYLVKRAPSAGGPFATIASIASTSFTDTGLANGTPLYYVVSSVNTGGESADSGVVSATPTAGITFGTYQQQYFTAAQVADPLVSGPAADANGDGLKNLLAYAFDISPWAAATANMPTAQNSGGYLAITFIRRKAPADITYAIEVSSDLATWNSGAAFTTDVSVTPRDANTDTVVVRDNTASSGAAKRFIRVKVTY